MTPRGIRLTVKGLAKYVAASPAMQRRILQEFKYPTADEPFAMRLYYREALDLLRTYIGNEYPREWLLKRVIELAMPGEHNSPAGNRRRRRNAEALLLCGQHFRSTPAELLPCPRVALSFYQVTISVVPDLVVRDRKGRLRVMKLQLGGTKLAEGSIKVVSQCLLEAALQHGLELSPASALYVDLPRNVTHSASKAGKRVLRDIEAACETISQIWDSIPPPVRTKRAVAA